MLKSFLHQAQHNVFEAVLVEGYAAILSQLKCIKSQEDCIYNPFFDIYLATGLVVVVVVVGTLVPIAGFPLFPTTLDTPAGPCTPEGLP